MSEWFNECFGGKAKSLGYGQVIEDESGRILITSTTPGTDHDCVEMGCPTCAQTGGPHIVACLEKGDPAPPDDGEKCQRCGEVGQDRRTLWMACLYSMNELSIPFNERAIEGRIMIRTGTRETIVGPVALFEIDKAAPSSKFGFYTLLVCKQCRGEWMESIERWFNHQPGN